QALLQRKLLQCDQCLLDVGEGGEHRLAIGLQVLQLQALRLLQLALQQEAVEDRLGQAGRERVEPCARRKQGGQRGALEASGARQLNLRKERGARGFDAEVGSRELCLGLADVRPLIEQFGRQSRGDARHTIWLVDPPCTLKFAGARATSRARAAIFCPKVTSSGGMAARWVDTSASCCDRSSCDAVPPLNCCLMSARMRSAAARLRRVTRIWSWAARIWK